ncbi:hypothetical protein RirG_034430 [Rhizophagus irregularis DAOM 197198w]|uniref:F-box domain-containing protein n=1 Tax=Rhizophagus irregularis (strain DAOM 197198w) TaxID=1432141 RepID=A0A015K9P3_RHIIW|nr:hypothetical protein RirG_034430 [Rhizophagus irregularis DAOM 197198w]
MPQLDADSLNEIFEYLEDDKETLRSCLLVNRFWGEISVRILWKIIRNYETIIACLPNESREVLYKNGINILTTKFPIYNYITYIKNLSIYTIDEIIKNILKNYQTVTPQNIPNITFILYPGAINCLKDLTELSCRSDIYPEFFYQLSQICHNIQHLDITFKEVISNGLSDLISVQKNLKYLDIMQYYECRDLTNIIPSLKKLPNTLIKFELYGYIIPLSFITKFTNLQELVLLYSCDFDESNDPFEDFNELQHVTFSQLQILRFEDASPKTDLLIKFLENNGKFLKEFHVESDNYLLNLAIAKYCFNLKIFSILILSYENYELESLKEIFNNCQNLESIKVKCEGEYEKELLDVISEYSPNNFSELGLYYSYDAKSKLLPDTFETFFVNWKNRTSLKSISLIIDSYSGKNIFDNYEEIMKVIEKYIKLGVIKKFIID